MKFNFFYKNKLLIYMCVLTILFLIFSFLVLGKLVFINTFPSKVINAVLIEKINYSGGEGDVIVYKFRYVSNNIEFFSYSSVHTSFDFYKLNIGDKILVKVSNFDNSISIPQNKYEVYNRVAAFLILLLIYLVSLKGFFKKIRTARHNSAKPMKLM